MDSDLVPSDTHTHTLFVFIEFSKNPHVIDVAGSRYFLVYAFSNYVVTPRRGEVTPRPFSYSCSVFSQKVAALCSLLYNPSI